jgi:hypothetical protein
MVEAWKINELNILEKSNKYLIVSYDIDIISNYLSYSIVYS